MLILTGCCYLSIQPHQKNRGRRDATDRNLLNFDPAMRFVEAQPLQYTSTRALVKLKNLVVYLPHLPRFRSQLEVRSAGAQRRRPNRHAILSNAARDAARDCHR